MNVKYIKNYYKIYNDYKSKVNNIIKYCNKYCNKYFTLNDETYPLLGRWCHINIPSCNQSVVLKKIDMANQDNNFCYKPKKV